MSTSEGKNRKKELRKEYEEKQINIFLASLPIPVSAFKALFDYVNDNIEINGCDDTLKFTSLYLKEHNLPDEAILNWIRDNGGYCDCEVIYNVEELFENL